MLLLKTSGEYDGSHISETNRPRDIRLRLNEFGSVDMHIQHPNSAFLRDPIELTQEQVADLACALAQLDRSLRENDGSYDDNDWEGDPYWYPYHLLSDDALEYHLLSEGAN